jgi:hypothetical protein
VRTFFYKKNIVCPLVFALFLDFLEYVAEGVHRRGGGVWCVCVWGGGGVLPFFAFFFPFSLSFLADLDWIDNHGLGIVMWGTRTILEFGVHTWYHCRYDGGAFISSHRFTAHP